MAHCGATADSHDRRHLRQFWADWRDATAEQQRCAALERRVGEGRRSRLAIRALRQWRWALDTVQLERELDTRAVSWHKQRVADKLREAVMVLARDAAHVSG